MPESSPSSSPVDLHLQAWYALLAREFGPLPPDASAGLRRRRFEAVTALLHQRHAPYEWGLCPRGVTTEPLELPLTARTLAARVYSPNPHGQAQPVVLAYFHGGGWVVGGLDTHDTLCAHLAHWTGCVVVSVDYRLAPEHPFPLPFDDACDSLRWLHERLPEFGATRLAAGGDSAGAHLAATAAHALAHAAPAASTNPLNEVAMAALLLFYPVASLDITRPSYSAHANGPGLTRDEMAWYWGQYLGAEPAQVLRNAVPRHDARLELLAQRWASVAPPTVVSLAGLDPLRDEGAAYAKHVRAELHEHPSLTHGFARLLTASPAALAATRDAALAFRALLKE